MRPVNRYVRLQEIVEPTKERESLVELPQGYAPVSQKTWYILGLADDCSIKCQTGDRVIVNDNMIERFKTGGGDEYVLIMGNYIVGVL